MGLNKTAGRKTYLSIGDGNIVRQHQNPIEGVTVTRINKNGVPVHEEFFNSVTAQITGISSKETSFGKVWEVTLLDADNEEYQLSWNYSSRYTNNFFRAIPNVDLDQEVTINPWSMKDKQDPTKKVIGMSLYQKGRGFDKDKVPFFYSKENPGKWPEMKQVKVKGNLVWDDTEQLDFIEKMVAKSILPKLQGVKAEASAPAAAKPVAAKATAQTDDEDFVPGADEDDETPF